MNNTKTKKLLDKVDEASYKSITEFSGRYAFLSNMYDCEISYNGLTFGSVEAAYQAQKTVSKVMRCAFTNMSGVEAKAFGRTVKLRSDWNSVKDLIMLDLVYIKFLSDSSMKHKLRKTYPKRIVHENNWCDKHFGVCDGAGDNVLGKILMHVRKSTLIE